MATTLRRFTISITPSMDADLDAAKKERYYKSTQNDMIRDLISRGLEALKAENEAENDEHDKASRHGQNDRVKIAQK